MNANNYKVTDYNIPMIENRADPYVYKHVDNQYYFTGSVPEYDRIVLRQGKTLMELAYAPEKTLWNCHETGIMSKHIWAPEIHYVEGIWYIYFAAGEKEDIWKIRPYVLKCTGQNPMEDEWIEIGQMKAADGDLFSFQDFSLDMTVFQSEGDWYCVWAEKVNVGKKISNLYIAKMKSPVELETAQVLLTAPDYDWERVDFWVNEGPAVIEHGDKLFLTFSASATGACYCMGLLWIEKGKDLLDPGNWTKSKVPVMTTDEEKGIYGPGHNCFVKSEDGTEDIMVYHARPYDEIVGDPLYDINRHGYRLTVRWDEEGMPVFEPEIHKRPNILMIVEDHVAYHGHSQVKTPNLDALKKKGVSFEHAYCSAPLCCPSRKSIVTGLYPHNHGQTDNSFETPVDSHETYMEVLKKQGYDNYYFGKWHASAGKPSDLGCKGVSYADYGNPYQQPEYQEYIKEKGIPGASMLVEKNMGEEGWIDDIREGEIYNFSRPMVNEALSGILQGPKESHEAYYVADLANKELEKIRKEGSRQPFMMRVDFWGPHQPYYPAQKFADLYPPENIEEYPNFLDDLQDKPASYQFDTGRGNQESRKLILPSAMKWEEWQKILSRCYGQITMVDEAAGQILKKLEETGLDRDTLVIWTADHGDALACHGGHFDKAFYLPEEVIRVPLVMSMPTDIPEGAIVAEPVSNVDLPATIVDVAGGHFTNPVDGKSLMPNLMGIQETGRAVMVETFGHLAPWNARAVLQGQWKYVWNKGDLDELYNLEEDPYELHNLGVMKEYGEKIKEMQEVLKRIREESGDKMD